MRYQLEAEVDGEIYIEEPVAFERDGVVVEFQTNQAGKLIAIAVSLQVSQDGLQEFANTLKTDTENPSLEIRVDEKAFDRLAAELQYIESELAFRSEGALREIAWDKPTHRVIPEDPEEEKLLDVTSFSLTRSHEPLPVYLRGPSLENIVRDLRRREALMIPKAFWREAMNNFHKRRYIQAFKEFYFIIEDFYAAGKSSERQVLKAFGRSPEFNEIADRCLKSVLDLPNHSEKLRKLLEEQDCDESASGLQKLLFRVRGSLSHYYSKSPKTRGTPFNQEEYWTIALVAMYIATSAIEYRVIAIDDGEIR